MIQMISIADLHPHKDNPRKDLGDLSELTESTTHRLRHLRLWDPP